jgi:signal transduction histidine kinase
VVFFLVYNETENEAKLATINNELHQLSAIRKVLERSKATHREAQRNLKNYVATHQKGFLTSFQDNTKTLSVAMDSIYRLSNTTPSWKAFLAKDKTALHNQQRLQRELDSILAVTLFKKPVKAVASASFQPYNFKEVLNSIQVESTKEVDTVKKKGFFSRMGSAIAGKVDVQKEKVNVLVTMKFGKEVSTGDVASQLAKAFETTNSYYAATFANMQSKLQTQLNSQSQKEAAFAAFNLQVLDYSANLVANYEQSLTDFSTLLAERYDLQYIDNKTNRNYAISGLVLLVIIISIILFFFTRMAFSYERRWYAAQLRIQESLQFKDRIVSMISHEIRSPLSIVSIYSKFLSSKIKDKDLVSVFDSLQFTTNSLQTLSNQILEFSKNETKKMELNNQVFPLDEEFNGMAKSLQTLVESNHNTFVYENNFPSQCKVNADVVKIHQLLYNVIGNANKFTTKGKIHLRCDLQEFSLSTWNLVVTIEDTGVGISKADLEHIFDNFYQGVVDEKVHNLGAGLGLNLCKELVELFDGTIQVTSELNKGTTVVFNLILKKG